MSNAKIGAGHAAAMARMGLAELRNAIFPDSNIAKHVEMGVYGSLTPGEVADGKLDRAPEVADEYDYGQERGSVLEQKLEQAQERAELARDDRCMERE